MLQRGNERQPHRLPGTDDLGRVSRIVICDGSGSSHGTSLRSTSSPAGSELGAPNPVGNGRRCRESSAVRHVFVAIRYSHVRNEDWPLNPL